MGGTRYIKPTHPNSFQVAPRAAAAVIVHGAPPGADGPPADAVDEPDMSSLLLPPPPLFSDEDAEEPPLPFLPPPAEFSNSDDPPGPAGLGPPPAGVDHPTPRAQNNTPTTLHLNRPSANPLYSSISSGLKPLIAPKPNGTPAKARSSGQPLPMPPGQRTLDCTQTTCWPKTTSWVNYGPKCGH
ncbi:basic proline-rich protein-like [Amblyraja radiata]|uniref:basic proline-rich protein-like n=1 Tax=Amblyraja radiata TaxID=386614 RepID=UPI001403FF0B|nr:basic proline-rich protein-like [Amblyraja radiata]